MKSLPLTLTVFGLVAAALALPAGAGGAQDGPADGNAVYRKVVPGTVAFVDGLGAPVGSGVLIDADQGLVLTAYHVIDGVNDENNNVRVFFPRKADGRFVTDTYEYAKIYRQNPNLLVISGKVLTFDPIKDLALVRLARVPDGATAVPLASEEPEPGQSLHVIGNSTGGRGGAFGYNRGYVRNSFLHSKDTFCFFALCHQSPTNRGDSGGPVVNDRGEVIAIISHGTTGSGDVEQVVDYSVHVRDIQAFVQGKTTAKAPCALPSGTYYGFQGKARFNNQQDQVVFPVANGDNLAIEMRGDGSTDLDVFLDPALGHPNMTKVRRDGNTDQEKVNFQATWDGLARVKVANFHAAALRAQLSQNRQPFPDETRENNYSLEITRAAAKPGPVTFIREIGPNSVDAFRLHYDAARKPARLTIVGQGHQDLDIAVFDPTNGQVALADTYESRETVSFTPAQAGVYTVRVVNLDQRRACRYFLLTD